MSLVPNNDLLLKNAIDSIQVGFEDYFQCQIDERRIISSIRNLHAGILLFLKWLIKKNTPGPDNTALIMKAHKLQIEGAKITAQSKGKKTIGKDEIFDRLEIVSITIEKNQKILLNKIGEIRNDIEHHFSNHPKQELENSILDAFWLIKDLKENHYPISNLDFFGQQSYDQLIALEKNFIKQKYQCLTKWSQLNLKEIENRLPGKIYDNEIKPSDLREQFEKFLIEEKKIVDEDERYFYECSLQFLSSIPCKACNATFTEPVESDFSSETTIILRCTRCSEKFTFRDTIENYLEEYYAYEIMKAGSKGGLFALDRCPKCHLGTFLNFDDICICCGNTDHKPEDQDFAQELMERNVNMHWGKW